MLDLYAQNQSPTPIPPPPPPTANDRQVSLDEFEEQVREHFKVPRNLLRSLNQQESGDNPNVQPSIKNARGRYQVKPETAAQYGMNADDPFDNVYSGIRYLRESYDAIKDKFDNEQDGWAGALAGYHGGPKAIDHIKRTGEIPNYSDGLTTTPQYVKSIFDRWAQFDKEGEDQQVTPAPSQQPVNAGNIETVEVKPGPETAETAGAQQIREQLLPNKVSRFEELQQEANQPTSGTVTPRTLNNQTERVPVSLIYKDGQRPNVDAIRQTVYKQMGIDPAIAQKIYEETGHHLVDWGEHNSTAEAAVAYNAKPLNKTKEQARTLGPGQFYTYSQPQGVEIPLSARALYQAYQQGGLPAYNAMRDQITGESEGAKAQAHTLTPEESATRQEDVDYARRRLGPVAGVGQATLGEADLLRGTLGLIPGTEDAQSWLKNEVGSAARKQLQEAQPTLEKLPTVAKIEQGIYGAMPSAARMLLAGEAAAPLGAAGEAATMGAQGYLSQPDATTEERLKHGVVMAGMPLASRAAGPLLNASESALYPVTGEATTPAAISGALANPSTRAALEVGYNVGQDALTNPNSDLASKVVAGLQALGFSGRHLAEGVKAVNTAHGERAASTSELLPAPPPPGDANAGIPGAPEAGPVTSRAQIEQDIAPALRGERPLGSMHADQARGGLDEFEAALPEVQQAARQAGKRVLLNDNTDEQVGRRRDAIVYDPEAVGRTLNQFGIKQSPAGFLQRSLREVFPVGSVERQAIDALYGTQAATSEAPPKPVAKVSTPDAGIQIIKPDEAVPTIPPGHKLISLQRDDGTYGVLYPEKYSASMARTLAVEQLGTKADSAAPTPTPVHTSAPADRQAALSRLGELLDKQINGVKLGQREAAELTTLNTQLGEGSGITAEALREFYRGKAKGVFTPKLEQSKATEPEEVSAPIENKPAQAASATETAANIKEPLAVADTANEVKATEESKPSNPIKGLVKAEPEAAAPETNQHEFSTTHLTLPDEVSVKLKKFGSQIPARDLAEDGRETEPHVTLLYGLHTNNADEVRQVLANEPPIKVKFGATSTFPAKKGANYEVVKTDVDSPDLHRLNKKISDALPHTDTHPTFEPHATIAYVKPGQGQKYAGSHFLRGQEATIDHITFSDKNGNRVEIPLTGQSPTSTLTEETARQASRRPSAVKRSNAPEDKSLSQFVRAEGGIKPDSDLSGERARLSQKELGTTGLVRKDGLSPDRMREAANEAGYDVPDTAGDFLFAVERDVAGEKTYHPGKSYDRELEAEWQAYNRKGLTAEEQTELETVDRLVKKDKRWTRLFDRVVGNQGAVNEADIQAFTSASRSAGISDNWIREIIAEGQRARGEAQPSIEDVHGIASEAERGRQGTERSESPTVQNVDLPPTPTYPTKEQLAGRTLSDVPRGELPQIDANERDVSSFFEEKAREARERLAERGQQKPSSNPERGSAPIINDLADYAMIGAHKIAQGVRRFDSWAREMVAEFGQRIKPHLENIYLQAMKFVRDERGAVNADLTEVKDEGKTNKRLRQASTLQAGAQLLTPKFVIRNGLSNAGLAVGENLSNAVASALDAAYSKLTGKPRQITLNRPGEFIRGAKEGVVEAHEAFQTGKALRNKTVYGERRSDFENPIGKAIEKSLYYANNVTDHAAFMGHYQQALDNLVRAQGASKTAPKLTLQQLHDQAWIEAQRATFQDPNFISRRLEKLKDWLNAGKPFGVGDFVIKYPKVPGAILRRGIEYSPLGFFDAAIEATRNGPFARRDALMALSRAAIGSVTGVGLGAVLNQMGVLTGPEEREKRGVGNIEREAGFRGYYLNASALKRWAMHGLSQPSSEIGKLQPGDKLWSIDWAQPYALELSAGAGAYDAWKKGKFKNLPDAVTGSLSNFLDVINDQSVLKNLAKYSNLSLKEAIKQTLKDVPSSFVPTLAAQTRQVVDPYVRDTRTEKENKGGAIAQGSEIIREGFNRAVNKIPFASERLPVRPDLKGKEGRTPLAKSTDDPLLRGAQGLFNPATVSRFDATPADEEMMRLGVGKSAPQRLPGEPLESLRQRETTAGKLFEDYRQRLVESAAYRTSPDDVRAEALNHLSGMVNEMSNEQRPQVFKLRAGVLIDAARESLRKRKLEARQAERKKVYVPPPK